jgi:hypothetical protein
MNDAMLDATIILFLFVATFGAAYGLYRWFRRRKRTRKNTPKPHDGWKLKKPEPVSRHPITEWKELPPDFPAFAPVEKVENIQKALRIPKKRKPANQ